MPTRKLPSRSHLDELKRQARVLLAKCASADPSACQRMREFHPRFADADDAAIAAARPGWSDGLFAIAREYGFRSWPRLKAHVDGPRAADGERPLHDRIADPVFREAVALIDDGDVAGLASHLDAHPGLVHRHVAFEGLNYFRRPGLLAFVAENPVRTDSMPPNVVEIATLLLDRGAGDDARDSAETLALVASGRVAREAGAQDALIQLLCARGADPDAALRPALVHGEDGAAAALIACGARIDLSAAAALGDLGAARRLIDAADAADRHHALAFAAQRGHVAILWMLLQAGADPNRYNPPDAHSHSTPLHQAAWGGHADAVRVLLDHGARTDLRDTLWEATPLEWARHAGQAAVVAMLEER